MLEDTTAVDTETSDTYVSVFGTWTQEDAEPSGAGGRGRGAVGGSGAGGRGRGAFSKGGRSRRLREEEDADIFEGGGRLREEEDADILRRPLDESR